MKLKKLKKQVYGANIELVKEGLVLFTWGNESGIDRDLGVMVIKPSGVEYSNMSADDMVVVDMEGNIVEGNLAPSSDTPTHLALYKKFNKLGGIAHSHSTYATAWAQAGQDLPVIGTTHADNFAGDVPCTHDMTEEEINGNYEEETGHIIIETFEGKDPSKIPGILVKNHGPFTWGCSPAEAVFHSIVLEEVARMAHLSFNINPKLTMNRTLAAKHFERKHGDDAYYGQVKSKK